jgi:hypothetical protein
MKKSVFSLSTSLASLMMFALLGTSCQKDVSRPVEFDAPERETAALTSSTGSVLLAIDESSIDNDKEPNFFSETDVNDDISRLGQRADLRYFKANVGKIINLYTGDVGDEGWFAIKTIPNSWRTAGPTANGARNYILAGRGLGTGSDPEALLDKIPNVTPLRARGLAMLTGQTVLAVVYDSEVSINYGPLNGSLKGETLGMVALKVLKVTRRTNGSSGSLPVVQVQIENVDAAKAATIQLFSNAPTPRSSSEPFDIRPPSTIPTIRLTTAP